MPKHSLHSPDSDTIEGYLIEEGVSVNWIQIIGCVDPYKFNNLNKLDERLKDAREDTRNGRIMRLAECTVVMKF